MSSGASIDSLKGFLMNSCWLISWSMPADPPYFHDLEDFPDLIEIVASERGIIGEGLLDHARPLWPDIPGIWF